MKIVEYEQGSPEWLAWRKGLLTATDAAMLMGVSPYATPFKGWKRKVGQAPEQVVNPAMLRGQRDEPIARDWFIKEYGIEMKPCCVESDSYNFIGSSLDGMSPCGKFLLEIKSNGDQYHYGLKHGIPEFHMMQMQHQLLSTDGTAEKVYYVSINKGEKIVKEVYPDQAWLDDYLLKAREFWQRVIFFDPPALSFRDYKDMNNVPDWYSYATEYRKVCDQIKTLETVKESYRNELVKLCGEESCAGSGIKVLRKSIKGRIDYDSILELSAIDLEKHRKKPTFSWVIMFDQK